MTTYQLRQFLIDGVNLGDEIVHWNDRVIFGRHKSAPENITTASIIIPQLEKISGDGKSLDLYATEMSRDDALALFPLTVFFACYHLVNSNMQKPIIEQSKFQMPIIAKSMSSAITPVEIKNAAHIFGGSGVIPNRQSIRNKLSNEESTKAMKETLPLFDKVMSIYNGELRLDELTIALSVYQRAIQEGDHLKDFLDLVIVLEALFSEGDGEISHKIAERTSIFSESDVKNRKDTFKKLKKIYNARSQLVHGKDLSFDRFGEYHSFKVSLIPIVQSSLFHYIEERSDGKSKDAILDHLTDISLGNINP